MIFEYNLIKKFCKNYGLNRFFLEILATNLNWSPQFKNQVNWQKPREKD